MMLLGVHKSAANNVVRAELGSCDIFLKPCVLFWLHVLEINILLTEAVLVVILG